MSTYYIAELIFWTGVASLIILVYQLALLPGIRLILRYRSFSLRDQLRLLVINGKIEESNPAFQLLHHRLNYMCVSMNRYDLARLIHSIKTMNDERRAEIEAGRQVMEGASEEIKKIYEESLGICVRALIFNSLFFFVISTICLTLFLLVKVGIRRLKQAFVSKVHEDTRVGFFAPELAAV
jgi:hypothetical protein